MRKHILITSIVIVCMLSLPALGCPDRNALDSHLQMYDYLSPGIIDDGTKITYVLNTINKPGASVIEYCVYPTPGFTGSDDDLDPLYVGWKVSYNKNKDYFGFVRSQGDDNIPIDGTTGIEIGEADYLSSDNVPTSEVILFHINDPDECGSAIT